MLQNHLKQLRANQGLTQQELAMAAGVIRQTVIAVEQNKYQPSVALALRFAQVLHVRVEDIFYLT